MKIKDYFLPKSFIYTGKHKNIPTQIIHYHYSDTSLEVTNNFKPIDSDKHYIQVIGLSDLEKIQNLTKHYQVDPLILEDVFNVNQRSKIEVKENYIFGVFHLEYLEKEIVKEDYLSLLMFKDTIISFHEKEPVYLDSLKILLEKSKDLKSKTIDYLFYQILDIVTDKHIDLFEYIDIKQINFEEEILDDKKINQDDFYLTRKNLLKLKNCVAPFLEQLDKTIDKSLLFNKSNRIYYDDLIDHLKRLNQQVDQARELMRNILDLHINNQSNQMNRIMTTLTLFSAIFIPLSFLTGFFGMNFVHFGILEYEYAIIVFIGLCFILAGLMVLLFKKMKWF